MKDDQLIVIIRILRQLAIAMTNGEAITPFEIERAKQICTRLYIDHANRKITLKNEDFHLVVKILEYEIRSNGTSDFF